MSQLQHCASGRNVLEVLQLWTVVRHLSEWGRVSQLPHPVPYYAMPRLRSLASDEPMGWCFAGSIEYRDHREINPFYAAHQHFRLADVFPTRYASEFQALLKPAISTSRTRFT